MGPRPVSHHQIGSFESQTEISKRLPLNGSHHLLSAVIRSAGALFRTCRAAVPSGCVRYPALVSSQGLLGRTKVVRGICWADLGSGGRDRGINGDASRRGHSSA